MNPFARLAGQAEVNLADLSRRAVESVTEPLKVKSQEVIEGITHSVTRTLKALAVKAGLLLFAAVMALIALGYALSALHAWLARVFGPIEATLIMAGVFAVLAILAVIVLLAWPKPAAGPGEALARARHDAEQVAAKARQEVRTAQRRVDEAVNADAAEGAHADPKADMRSGVSALATALGAAGFRKEQAGLRAGLALAEQLRPMQLVSLALIGGFVAGIRMSRRRR